MFGFALVGLGSSTVNGGIHWMVTPRRNRKHSGTGRQAFLVNSPRCCLPITLVWLFFSLTNTSKLPCSFMSLTATIGTISLAFLACHVIVGNVARLKTYLDRT